MEILDEEGRTVEGVYRIDADGSVTRVIGRELERPNGVLVSAADRFLFVADNNNEAVDGAPKLGRSYGPGDVAATIYKAIGLNTETLLYNRQLQPIPMLPEGEPIPRIL